MIAKFQWAVSKTDIHICCPCRFVNVLERVPVFVVAPVAINTFIGFKAVPQVLQVFSFVGKYWAEGHKVPLGSLLVKVL